MPGKRLRAVWMPEYDGRDFHHAVDAEDELTRILSEEISREVDNEIINRISRRINGGENFEIRRNINYLTYYMGIGGHRA